MIQLEELRTNLTNIKPELMELRGALDLETGAQEVEQLEKQTAQPGFWDQPEHSQKVLQRIKQLKDKGYSSAEIARKTGFTAEYINQISKLLFRGEERLINAVYTDRIPLNVAIDISDADDKDVQNVLREAYEAGQIRGNKLAFVKDLIERRIKKGKSI